MSKKGFTLAEILITLTVIGVVAALTIPTLLQNTNQAELKTALKRVFSDLNQATMLITNDNGGTLSGAFQNESDFRNKYSEKMNYIKRCTASVNEGCIGSSYYPGLDGTGTGGTDAFNVNGLILNNGAIVILKSYSDAELYNCNHSISGSSGVFNEICGTFYIDVNGLKRPNTVGKDLFVFSITKSGAYPLGAEGTPLGISDFTQSCNPDNQTYSWRGQGCAAKYLYE